MNIRQTAIISSLIIHLFVLLLCRYFWFSAPRTELQLYETSLVSLSPVQQPVLPEKAKPKIPVPHTPTVPASPVPVSPPLSTEQAEEHKTEPAPGISDVIVTQADSIKKFKTALRVYFRHQHVIPFQGDKAAFMDYDPASVIKVPDSLAKFQRFLEERLASMALSPKDLDEIYPPGDRVGEDLRRNQGIAPTLPMLPIGALVKAALDLTKKAIGYFSKPPDQREGLLALSEQELMVLNTMWTHGWASLSEIFVDLPKEVLLRSTGLAMLLDKLEKERIVVKQNRNGNTQYVPAMSKSDVMQFYLANLAALHWASEKNVPVSDTSKQILIRKIALLNGIALEENDSQSE